MKNPVHSFASIHKAENHHRRVHLKENCIRFVDSAKNLGVIIDSLLNFEEQVDKLVKACFLTIRELAKVKVYLSQQELQVLVSARVF